MNKVKVFLFALCGCYLCTGAEAPPKTVDVHGGFVYNHGIVNPDDAGMVFTNAGVRDVTVSVGQLSGVDPETGIVITNAANLLSLKAKSLTAASNVVAGGYFIGDGSLLVKLDVNSLDGPINASSLPVSGIWNASGVVLENAQFAGPVQVTGNGAAIVFQRNGEETLRLSGDGTAHVSGDLRVGSLTFADGRSYGDTGWYIPSRGDLSMGAYTLGGGLSFASGEYIPDTSDLSMGVYNQH